MRRYRILILVLILLGMIPAWLGYRIWGPALPLKDKKFFYLSHDCTPAQLAEQLEKEGVVSSARWVTLLSRPLKLKRAKAGRYEITPGMNLYSLIKIFSNNQQSYVKLSIVKVRTLQELSGKIGSQIDTQIDSLTLLSFLTNNDSLRAFGVDTSTLLSIIMPFTYTIGWTESPGQLLEKMKKRHGQFWNKALTQKANAKGLTPTQVSILASIVEEESNRSDDRYKIASTYLNRLRLNMKLQADPTVKYVTRNFRLRRILYEHLKLESPYNTYLHKGLPPGPICTPSIQSIEAVLDAPLTDYLYFVASYKFDGTTLFSSTYEQHLSYVRLFHEEQKRRLNNSK